ncbi:MAG: hypothetical protein GMKNLPBB_01550 [Myxococcota bacterium]|nr:hypothetical protein [Myxococcota bacterium]
MKKPIAAVCLFLLAACSGQSPSTQDAQADASAGADSQSPAADAGATADSGAPDGGGGSVVAPLPKQRAAVFTLALRHDFTAANPSDRMIGAGLIFRTGAPEQIPVAFPAASACRSTQRAKADPPNNANTLEEFGGARTLAGGAPLIAWKYDADGRIYVFDKEIAPADFPFDKPVEHQLIPPGAAGPAVTLKVPALPKLEIADFDKLSKGESPISVKDGWTVRWKPVSSDVRVLLDLEADKGDAIVKVSCIAGGGSGSIEIKPDQLAGFTVKEAALTIASAVMAGDRKPDYDAAVITVGESFLLRAPVRAP